MLILNNRHFFCQRPTSAIINTFQFRGHRQIRSVDAMPTRWRRFYVPMICKESDSKGTSRLVLKTLEFFRSAFCLSTVTVSDTRRRTVNGGGLSRHATQRGWDVLAFQSPATADSPRRIRYITAQFGSKCTPLCLTVGLLKNIKLRPISTLNF